MTSGAIDSMYENGVHNVGDVGSAIKDGAGELEDTGGDLVHLAGGIKNAIF